MTHVSGEHLSRWGSRDSQTVLTRFAPPSVCTSMPPGFYALARETFASRRRRASVVVVLLLLIASSIAFGEGNPPREPPRVATSDPIGGAATMTLAEVSLEAGAGPAHGTRPACVSTGHAVAAVCEFEVESGTASSSSPPYPDPRWGSELADDASDGYLLLFGATAGNEPTWSFSNDNWSSITSSPAPRPRPFACMTYDWRDGYVVLFGGEEGGIGTPTAELGDTWTFHAGLWTNVSNPADSPPPLAYPSCAYDAAPGDGYVLLFGGATGVGPGYTGGSGLTVDSTNQTWAFSGGKWTNLTNDSAPHPSARFGASMAYEPADQYVVLYGGAVDGTSTANGSCSPVQCPHLNDTWKFVGGTWTNITASASPNGTPPGRWEASMTNDSADGYDLIFGGQANGYKALNATGNYTWAFDRGQWVNVSSSSASTPGTRFGAAMGYFSTTESVVMYSGLSGTVSSPLRDDTWVFHQGKWECVWYAPTFTETGLPTNTSWGVTVTPVSGSPATYTSSTASISFVEPNASYAYSIEPIAGYHLKRGSYSGTLTAETASVVVKWAQVTYAVEFFETGLPATTFWSVTMTSSYGSPTVQNSTTGNVQFSQPNGTYTYSASATGYTSRPGHLTVNGSSPSAILLEFLTPSSSPSTLPLVELAIVGAAAVVAALALFAWWRRRRGKAGSAPTTTRSSPGAGSSPPVNPP